MIKYPLNFSISMKDFKTSEVLDFNFAKVDIPLEFGGLAREKSPEEYFVVSVVSCFLTTLTKLSNNVGLEFKITNFNAQAILDRGEDTKPFVKNIIIDFCIHSSDELESKRIIENVKTNCFIINSIKTQVDWNITYINENI